MIYEIHYIRKKERYVKCFNMPRDSSEEVIIEALIEGLHLTKCIDDNNYSDVLSNNNITINRIVNQESDQES